MELTTLWACVDCLMIHANDDDSGMAPERAKDVRDALAPLDVSLGLDVAQHADDCEVTRDYMEGVARDFTDCECDRIDFSWSPCEVCLSPLGGSRHALTLWSTN